MDRPGMDRPGLPTHRSQAVTKDCPPAVMRRSGDLPCSWKVRLPGRHAGAYAVEQSVNDLDLTAGTTGHPSVCPLVQRVTSQSYASRTVATLTGGGTAQVSAYGTSSRDSWSGNGSGGWYEDPSGDTQPYRRQPRPRPAPRAPRTPKARTGRRWPRRLFKTLLTLIVLLVVVCGAL